MTPFERAAYNVRQLAIKLNLYTLLLQTIEDTEKLSKEDADKVWQVILAMLEASDMLDENN
jgi:hypothetical protein